MNSNNLTRHKNKNMKACHFTNFTRNSSNNNSKLLCNEYSQFVSDVTLAVEKKPCYRTCLLYTSAVLLKKCSKNNNKEYKIIMLKN